MDITALTDVDLARMIARCNAEAARRAREDADVAELTAMDSTEMMASGRDLWLPREMWKCGKKGELLTAEEI